MDVRAGRWLRTTSLSTAFMTRNTRKRSHSHRLSSLDLTTAERGRFLSRLKSDDVIL